MDKPPKGAALSDIRAWDKAQSAAFAARQAEGERMAAAIDVILAEVAANPHPFTPDTDPDTSDPGRCEYELPSGYQCGGQVEDPEHHLGWPCQCGHYRHDDGFCSGTLGSMLDTDGLRPEDDPSTPCVCAVYVPVDADWARGVGFTS